MSTQHGFWILATDNRVFDRVVTRHLNAHGDIFAIHAFYQSDSYSYSDIVRRLKSARPPRRVSSTHGRAKSPAAVTRSVLCRLWTV
jgi:hypothetical protein